MIKKCTKCAKTLQKQKNTENKGEKQTKNLGECIKTKNVHNILKLKVLSLQ